MAEKHQETLLMLYNNVPLRKKVEEALDIGTTYSDIVELCKKSGLDVSRSALTRYKKKRQEADIKSVPVGELIAGTTEWEAKISNSIEDKSKANQVKHYAQEAADTDADDSTLPDKVMDEPEAYLDEGTQEVPVTRYLNDIEFLDGLIQKGARTLAMQDGVAPKDALKAVEIKNKLTDGALRGMTVKGIQALQTKQQKLSYVLSSVILNYVPKDKQEEARKSIDKAEAEFNRNLELDKDYTALKRALKAGGVDSDSL